MLIIQPSGGLCNRMRVINSAWELAKERKEELVVLWYLCPELNCSFDELFQPLKEIRIISLRSLKDPRKLRYQLFAQQRLTNDDIINNRIGELLKPEFVNSLKKNVYLSTWEHFYPSHDYHFFVPVEDLQKRIEEMTARYGTRPVGVHIRRTDNTISLGKSTTEQFVALMKQELTNYPETMFYLATDDRREEAFMRQTFPGKILSHESRTLDRNSPEGIKDALLDLWCLSSTDKLIGSYWSSFTDIAADMRGIPKIIAGE